MIPLPVVQVRRIQDRVTVGAYGRFFDLEETDEEDSMDKEGSEDDEDSVDGEEVVNDKESQDDEESLCEGTQCQG